MTSTAIPLRRSYLLLRQAPLSGTRIHAILLPS